MKDKDIQMIEDHIEGNLTGDELVSFNLRLASDSAFAKAYEERKKLAQLWNETREYQATKEFVKDALSNQKPEFFISYRYHLLSVAAALVILIGGYFLLLNERGHQPDGLNGSVAVSDTAKGSDHTIRFKVDEPMHLAAIDTVQKNVRLIHPIAGASYKISEPITFMWESDQNLIDTILIRNETSSTVLSRVIVNLSDSAYTMKYPQFDPGYYTWNLTTCDQMGRFTIINEK